MRDAGLASLGGAVVLLMAWLLASFQPDPTLIDRAFPVVALSLWLLASRSRGTWREGAMLLVPVSFAIELGVADPQLRLLLLGGVLALAATTHVAQLEIHWKPVEILTALAIVIPLRIVEPAIGTLAIEALMVAGTVLLWTELRRGGTPPALTVAAVLLLAVTIPAGSLRLAAIPLVMVALVYALRGESWIARIVAVSIGLVVSRWIAVTTLLILLVAWLSRRRSVTSEHGATEQRAFVPSLGAIAGNLPAVIAPLPFFPSLFASPRAVVAVIAPVVLAMVVRPSLAGPIVAVGIIAGCALWTQPRGRGSRRAAMEPIDREPAGPNLVLPALTLLAMIMLFFPWSGTIVARPPGPVPLIVTLAVAAMALLPSVAGRVTPVVAVAIVAVVVMALPEGPDRRREIGRSLEPGEQVSLRLDGAPEEVEVLIAGGNLADAAAGRSVATMEVVDAQGRGYSRTVAIGEVADWGAFRPELVLRTLNPRPDAIATIEASGAASWVRGTGRIGFPTVSGPRWIVITARSDLETDERVIIEEIRTR